MPCSWARNKPFTYTQSQMQFANFLYDAYYANTGPLQIFPEKLSSSSLSAAVLLVYLSSSCVVQLVASIFVRKSFWALGGGATKQSCFCGICFRVAGSIDFAVGGTYTLLDDLSQVYSSVLANFGQLLLEGTLASIVFFSLTHSDDITLFISSFYAVLTTPSGLASGFIQQQPLQLLSKATLSQHHTKWNQVAHSLHKQRVCKSLRLPVLAHKSCFSFAYFDSQSALWLKPASTSLKYSFFKTPLRYCRWYIFYAVSSSPNSNSFLINLQLHLLLLLFITMPYICISISPSLLFLLAPYSSLHSW